MSVMFVQFTTEVGFAKIYLQNLMRVDVKWLLSTYITQGGVKGELLLVCDYNHQKLLVNAQQNICTITSRIISNLYIQVKVCYP